MPNPSIPEEVKKRIEEDAEAYNKDSEFAAGYFGYIDGATTEAARAEELRNVIKDILFRNGTNYLLPSYVEDSLTKALQQKGGENE